MEKETGSTNCPQAFFNSTYFGSLQTFLDQKASDEQGLKKKILDALTSSDVGELYQVYKRQYDIFEINSPDLYFPSPLNRSITCILTIQNRSEDYAAFKLKTMTPKKFNVFPKEEIIGPNESSKVEIKLNKDSGTETEMATEKFRIEGVKIVVKDQNFIIDKNIITEAFNLNPKAVVKQTIDCKVANPPSNCKVVTFNDGTLVIEAAAERKIINDVISTTLAPLQKEKVLKPGSSFTSPRQNFPANSELFKSFTSPRDNRGSLNADTFKFFGNIPLDNEKKIEKPVEKVEEKPVEKVQEKPVKKFEKLFSP